MTMGCNFLLSGLLLGIACAMPTIVIAQDDTEIADPPDTNYSSGLDEMDPATVSSLPTTPTFRAFIPISTDLSFLLPKPGNQGKANSCVAWSVAYAARSYYTGKLENRDLTQLENLPSPNYVYTLGRQFQKKAVCDAGMNIYSAVQVLKMGAPSLAAYPYHADDCDQPPPSPVIATANDFRVIGLSLINNKHLDDVKGALAQSNPLIIEFHDSPSFHKLRGSDVYADTSFDQTKDEWHAMTLVGYDDRKQAFQLINSWGARWGDNGYAWIGYDVFLARVRRVAKLQVPKPVVTRPPPIIQPAPHPPVPVAVVTPPVITPPVAPPKPPAPLPAPVGGYSAPPAPLPLVVDMVKEEALPKPPEPKPQLVEVKPPVPVPQPAPVVGYNAPPPPPVAIVKRQAAPPTPPEPRPLVAEVNPPAPVQEPPKKAELADLAHLSCAHVIGSKHDGQNVLSGFVGSDADFEIVRHVAADVAGTLVGDILVAPWPQCELLQTLAKPLNQADVPKIDIGGTNVLRRGDLLRVAIQSPPQISYLYVSYVQADGTVVHLVQPEGLVAKQTLPNQRLFFGDGIDGRPRFEVGAPYGAEMIITIAARSPLFEGPLPQHQTEREFMTALRRALFYKPSPDMPDREVSASIATIATREK